MENISEYNFSQSAFRFLTEEECKMPIKLMQKSERMNIVLRRSRAWNGNISNVPKQISSAWFYTWGYQGTGPHDLAMNILFHWTGNAGFAQYWSTELVQDVISRIPIDVPAEINAEYISNWVEAKASLPIPKSENILNLGILCAEDQMWNNQFKTIQRPLVID